MLSLHVLTAQCHVDITTWEMGKLGGEGGEGHP